MLVNRTYTDAERNLNLSEGNVFKFNTKLSFKYLIEFWEKELDEAPAARRALAEQVFANLPEGHPLRADVIDIEEALKHEGHVDLLMTAAVPISAREHRLTGAFVPFHYAPVFATTAFLDLRYAPDSLAAETHRHFDIQKTQTAYAYILRDIYGQNISPNYNHLIQTRDPETGLSRFFRAELDTQFVRLEITGDKPELTDDEMTELLEDPSNLARYEELLPPDRFQFRGVSIVRAVDVTFGESLSRLKQDMLVQDALVSPANLDNIQQRIRSFLGHSDIQVGIIALDRCTSGEVKDARQIGRSILLKNGMPGCEHPEDTLYFKCISENRGVVANGLSRISAPTGFMDAVIQEGIESLYLAPLRDEGTIIGVIEIGSTTSGRLTPPMIPILDEVAGLFSTALKRSLDEQEDRVQALIKRQFTAIHPVVEWKFRRIALETLGNEGGNLPMIRFEGVHSLFGTSDIRGSSTVRGKAIQEDVAEQLGLALAAVIAASTTRPRPFLDELGFRISSHIEKVMAEVNSGDEITYSRFLREEVEPLFDEFRTWSPDVDRAVQQYYDALDQDKHLIYKKRKAFDDSVAIINDRVGHYMQQRQVEAQDMIPHYFEMFRSDGVEYTLYAGNSLLNGVNFSELDLKNLKLWQLITMAGIAALTNRLADELPIRLETAQLILVQSSPVDIHFRADEKKFDVEGAYNIRYEIVKKRIDKATIKGTGERLTQPGTIALVYSQREEATEYKQYLRYLFAAGYLEGEIEKYELDALPGVNGLHALRVRVAEHPPVRGDAFGIPDPAEKRSHKTAAGDGDVEA